ncbi:MAG TPA: HD domain-containing phosphohydrolase [Fibrobacteraceae bacterium]|nr:HD domain-containing phosphohydrolase [Fibrobacteraceae bacterium]
MRLQSRGIDSCRGCRVLAVESEQEQRQLLQILLSKNGWSLTVQKEPDDLRQRVTQEKPDLVLLDLGQGESHRLEACRAIKTSHWQNVRDTAVICLSAYPTDAVRRAAFQACCDDFLAKPWDPDELLARIRIHVRHRKTRLLMEQGNQQLRQRLSRGMQKLLDSQRSLIRAMAKLSESRDDDTGRHIERVQHYVARLVRELRKRNRLSTVADWAELVVSASCLHDIGKMAIPDAVLRKPGSLNPEEQALMKQHAEVGYQTLHALHCEFPENQFLAIGKDIARSHHERWDGTGYPQGLRGEEIPVAARIMTIADVYDALRSPRCYKPPLPHAKTLEIMRDMAVSHFDPELFALFLRVEKEFDHIYTSWRDDSSLTCGIRAYNQGGPL